MKKNSISISKRNIYRKNLSQPNLFQSNKDIDFDIYVDGDTRKKINEQLDKINDQIENIGIICDKRKKSTYNIFQSFIKLERKKLNDYLEESFLNLQKDVQDYKGKLSFDYSGTLSNLRLKVKNLEKDSNNNRIILKNIQEKKLTLLEDNYFYERQIENTENLNEYLKMKLKNLKDKNIKNEVNNMDNSFSEKINNEIKSKEKKVNHSSSMPNILKKKKVQLYLTRSNSINDTLKDKKQNIRYLMEKKLKKTMTYIIKIINKNIEKEEEKGKNLRKYFNNIYDKTNNPYMDIFKGCLNEVKNKDSESNIIEQNQNSSFGGLNISSLNSLNLSKLSTNNDSYINKLKKKDIIINFLQNNEVKRLIYNILKEKK